MLANAITLFRLFLTFGTIALFGRCPGLDVSLIFTITLIFILDAFDGYIARKRSETSKLGFARREPLPNAPYGRRELCGDCGKPDRK